MYCSYYALQHSIDVITVRFQNVYGPREILGAGDWRGTESTIWRNVIPTFIYRALENQKLFVNSHASRDFIFIEDLVLGISLAKEKGKSGSVYNLGTGKEIMISELARKIIEAVGSDTHYEESYSRAWDRSGRRIADIEKSKKEIGFIASTSIDEGIEKTVTWFKSNLDLIKSCINKHEE
jgi:nucleoside-diphosphate-sugar epimerase